MTARVRRFVAGLLLVATLGGAGWLATTPQPAGAAIVSRSLSALIDSGSCFAKMQVDSTLRVVSAQALNTRCSFFRVSAWGYYGEAKTAIKSSPAQYQGASVVIDKGACYAEFDLYGVDGKFEKWRLYVYSLSWVKLAG